MTQLILSLNAGLVALSAAIAADQLDSLGQPWVTLLAVAVAVAIAMVSPFLPVVSAALRRVQGLQRRG